MAAHFLLQIFQRFTQHIGHNANAGYHKQKVRHGFHLLSTEVLRNSVQPAATQWSAFHCRQTKLNHIYCCPSILFHTVNEHIRIFVQIPITGAADSFSHGCAVPDLRRFACLLPAQRAASSTSSKRELQLVDISKLVLNSKIKKFSYSFIGGKGYSPPSGGIAFCLQAEARVARPLSIDRAPHFFVLAFFFIFATKNPSYHSSGQTHITPGISVGRSGTPSNAAVSIGTS